MTKAKNLVVVAILILLLFLSETNVYADGIGISPMVLGIGLLIILAIVVSFLALIAWIIIRYVRKTNDSSK